MKKFTIAALVATAAAGTFAFAALADHHGDKGPKGEHLKEADANGDGNLTKAEIEAHKAAMKSQRFAAADTDGDNLVSFAEFEAHGQTEAAKRQAERRQRMFIKLDANSDGFITAEEMAAGKGRREDRGDKMFDSLDTDGDGVLTEAEREAAQAKRAEQRGERGERGEGRRGRGRGGE